MKDVPASTWRSILATLSFVLWLLFVFELRAGVDDTVAYFHPSVNWARLVVDWCIVIGCIAILVAYYHWVQPSAGEGATVAFFASGMTHDLGVNPSKASPPTAPMAASPPPQRQATLAERLQQLGPPAKRPITRSMTAREAPSRLPT